MPDTTDAALDAQLKTVLDRETATHSRHDARVETLEAERDAAYARGMHDALAACEASPTWMEARDAIRALKGEAE